MSDLFDEYRNTHEDFDKLVWEGNYLDDPYQMFETWFEYADKNGVDEANAFSLTTSTLDGKPSSRILYFKEFWEDRFVFYTNYASRKGHQLAVNPHASMLFFWPTLQQQIRIEGTVVKVPAAMSDAYFASRPRSSQLGAWASHQSDELLVEGHLQERLANLDKEFPQVVPRPDHWGGYALKPEYFEFWQGRPSRLHDRHAYLRQENGWKAVKLNP